MGLLGFRKTLVLVGLSVCALLVGLNHLRNVHQRSKRGVQIVDKRVAEGRADKPKFTFPDIYNSKFSYKSRTPRWVSGNEYIYMNESSTVLLRNVATDTETVLMDGKFYTDNSARSYKVSADQKYIALLTNYKKGWRHSYNGTYLIYDVENEEMKDAWKTDDDVQYFTWSTSGNAYAYVRGFNIYYMPTVDGTAVQVTDDGRAEYIFNGIPDWVYEEEMISSNNVLYFSPSGKYLAYARFDDTMCQHVNFDRYDGQQYPVTIDVAYPKAGTNQPTNKVFVFDTVSNGKAEIMPTATLSSGDYLFNRVTWANDNRAAVMWSNRIQTISSMRLCDINDADLSITYIDSDNFGHESTTGWLYQRRPYWIPVFGATPDEYFTVRPSDNWQHLYKVSNSEVTLLTSGEYTVTSESASYPAVEFYDDASGKTYFSATKESPQHRHIYRNNPSDTSQPECITCKYAVQYPGRCDYVTSTFSINASNTVIRCGGDGVPLYIEAEVNATSTDPELVLINEEVIEGNEDLVTTVRDTDMSAKEYGTYDNDGITFTYQIWKPPNFDATKKYPLLIDVYAGPGYQRVVAGWSRSWQYRFLPSSLDVVVASVDGRGSLYYGEEFMHAVYKKLGQLEPLDQLAFAKHMGGMDYIDENRIAVWGWSYGGYTTSLILGNDADDTIKCGFAVAPLADWRFYDTIYAERYMSLPSATDNEEGYVQGSVLTLAKNIGQSKYYLIHGTADDNVHFQNAARIQYELVENDIDFNDFFYADQDHSINVGNAREHVYKVLTRQVCQCFGLTVPDDVWTP